MELENSVRNSWESLPSRTDQREDGISELKDRGIRAHKQTIGKEVKTQEEEHTGNAGHHEKPNL